MHHWIIYMYIFPNGKKYIGKTRSGSLKARQKSNMVGYKGSTYLYNAINKYGIDNIEEKILFEEDMEDDYADRLEQICILLFKTNCCNFNNPKFGYNMTDGGGGMKNWHPEGEELKRRQEQMYSFHNKRRGKKYGPLSDEQKEKISKSLKNKHITKEERKKRVLCISKGVKITNLKTNKVRIFNSRADAAEYMNVKAPSINRWITGERKTPQGFLIEDYSGTTTERNGAIINSDATV